MNAHWPKHKVWHREQKEVAKEMRVEGTAPERDRSLAQAEARLAKRTGSEYDKRFAAALALMAEGDLHAAAKAWRKMINEWPHRQAPYHNLAVVLDRAGHYAESASMCLKAMELYEDGTEDWAEAAASAFDLLKTPDCCDAPKPEWWNDEGLKALSARVVVVAAPNDADACNMRARVLCGDALSKAPWNVKPRTAAEIKEAATWYRRGAMVATTPANKLRYEQHAQYCDEFADPLLAEEEAEVAETRAAAEAEAAEAMKVAEAKAAAAAEELLAEEEKEKQLVRTKAGKATPKGKKGKGRR